MLQWIPKEIGYFSSIMEDLLNENKKDDNAGKKIPTPAEMQNYHQYLDESNNSNDQSKAWAQIHFTGCGH